MVPSLWVENTPLVVYSAQAAGVPVVTRPTFGLACAVRDMIDGLLFALAMPRRSQTYWANWPQRRHGWSIAQASPPAQVGEHLRLRTVATGKHEADDHHRQQEQWRPAAPLCPALPAKPARVKVVVA